MDAIFRLVHPLHMAKQHHFLREWRKHKGLTLEQAAERVGTTHATLSRIERGKLPYNQTLLELLADIYQTEPASLLMRDPSQPNPIYSLWETLEPQQQRQAEIIINALKTGTGG